MKLTDADKRVITERVRAGAAALFRAHGYDGVSLDEVMASANLTRGAFYAHYASKAALFADVVRHEHPLLRMLRERPGRRPGVLRRQMMEIFAGYLTPEHLDEVFSGCTLAALTGDVTRAADHIKAAFGIAFQDILDEMARGQDAPADHFAPALLLASGAVRTAHALSCQKQKARVLSAAHQTFVQLVRDI